MRLSTNGGDSTRLIPALLLIGGMLVGAIVTVRADEAALPDPVPVRRVLLPARDQEALWQQLRQGVFRRLPWLEFEQRLQQAARARQQAGRTPRLLQARYWAQLQEGELKGGADWTLDAAGAVPAVFPVPDLNVAVSNVKIRGERAVIGVFAKKTPGLLVKDKGKQSVFFDWSLGGKSTTGEKHFAFVTPACAAGSLELKLPVEYAVGVATPGVLLTGPDDAGQPGLHLWRLRFSGTSKINLVLHRLDSGGGTPFFLSSVQTRQELFPNHQTADFAFRVEILHKVVNELEFEWQAPLVPLEVRCPSPTVALKNYYLKKVTSPGGKKGGGKVRQVLVVEFHRPLRGLLPIHIRCLAPLPKSGRWHSPRLKLKGAVSFEEKLTLAVHPQLQTKNWNFGAFQLVNVTPAGGGKRDITFMRRGSSAMSRPSVELALQQPELSAQQRNWWQIGHKGSSLQSRTTFRVNHGTAYNLELELPRKWKGWQLESVALSAKELLRRQVTYVDKGRWILFLELKRGLTAQEEITLDLLLTSNEGTKVPAKGVTLDFPLVQPLHDGPYRGSLGISVDPLYVPRVFRATGSVTSAPQEKPWGESLPQFYFDFQQEAVRGRIRLTPQQSQYRARWQVDATVRAGQAVTNTTLELEPIIGVVPSVDLYLSAPLTANLTCTSPNGPEQNLILQRLRLKEKLPLLLSANAAGVFAGGLAELALPKGQWWRLTFAEPLKTRRTFVLKAALPSPSAEGAVEKVQTWEIPLPVLANAVQVQGRAQVSGIATRITTEQTTALKPNQVNRGDSLSLLGFDYVLNTALPVAPHLRIRSQPLATSPVLNQERCEVAQLTTIVRRQGRLLHHFSFEMHHWRQPYLPVELPEGARVLYARVQGKWTSQLVQSKKDGRARLILSADINANIQRFEIVYLTPGQCSTWQPVERVVAAAPSPPTPPLRLRRIWRLESDLAPLQPLSFIQQSGGDQLKAPGFIATSEKLWHAGEDLPLLFKPTLQGRMRSRLLPILQRAERDFRAKHGNNSWQLAGALCKIVMENTADSPALIIDTQAMENIGLAPGTMVGNEIFASQQNDRRPFWERLGLTAVAVPRGVLLTTPKHWKELQTDFSSPSALQDWLNRKMEDALLHGQDGSGRFQSVFAWARPASNNSQPLLSLLHASQGPAWTDWELLADSNNGATMTIVHSSRVAVLGGALTLLSVLVSWLLCWLLPVRSQLRWLMLLVIGGVLLVMWVPASLQALVWLPVPAAIVVHLCRIASAPYAAPGRSDKPSHVPVAAGAILLMAVGGLLAAPAWGQPEKTYTVFLPVESGDKRKPETVYVPQELLDRLQRITKESQTSTPAAVAVQSQYDGMVRGQYVDFVAHLDFFCFSDSVLLHLPFENIELREGALLEGAPAFPVPAPGGKSGYLIAVKERKNRFVKLSLPFRVARQKHENSREIEFRIPSVLQNQLLLRLPNDSLAVQSLSSHGHQRISKENGFLLLESDLGAANHGAATSKVHVRWHALTSPSKKVQIEVSEYHLINLETPADVMTSVFQYAVRSGSVSNLELDLPDNRHVRSVEILQPLTAGINGGSARLKSWRLITDKKRRILRVQLQSPATGDFQLFLGLAVPSPRQGDTALVLLPTPRKATTTEGMLGLIAENSEYLDKAFQLSYSSADGKLFSQKWQQLGMVQPLKTILAYRFRRNNANSAAGARIAWPATNRQAKQNLHWHLHPDRADLRATLTVTSSRPEVMFVEWDAPANLALTSVRATDLLDWNAFAHRGKKRVQIWFNRPRQSATITIDGWVRAKPQGQSPLMWRAPAKKNGRFTAPAFDLAAASSCQTTIHISADKGLEPVAVANPKLKNVSPAPNLEWFTERSDYSLTVPVRRARLLPEARTIVTVARKDNNVLVNGVIHFQLPLGDITSATVFIRNWRGKDVQLDAPRARNVVHQRKGNTHSWRVQLPPGVTQRYTMRFSGAVSIDEKKKIALPAIKVEAVESSSHYVALLDSHLEILPKTTLTPVTNPPAQFALWIPELEKLTRTKRLWKRTSDEHGLQIEIKPIGAPATRMLAAEQQAILRQQNLWLHQGSYALIGGSGRPLQLTLPPRARLLTIVLNGRDLLPPLNHDATFRVELPDTPAVHALVVRWVYPAGAESLSRPILSPVQFKGVAPYPILWTVSVPQGYDVISSDQNSSLADPISSDLRRTEALLRISSALAQRRFAKPSIGLDEEMAGVQKAFYWSCSTLRIRLSGDSRVQDVIANPQPYLQWLERLNEQNRNAAQRFQFESIRLAAEQAPALSSPWGEFLARRENSGIPVSWYGSENVLAPRIRLLELSESRVQRRLWISEFLIGLLIVGWVLCGIPGAVALLRFTWPEQLLAIAIVGTMSFGLSLVSVALVVAAAAGRLSHLYFQLRHWRRRRSAGKPQSSPNANPISRS